MPCRSAGVLIGRLRVGDVAVAVLPHGDHLEALLLGFGRDLGPEHLLLDLRHVARSLTRYGISKTPNRSASEDITVEGSAMSTRAELQLLQQLLVAAELARAEHHDLGLVAELGVGARRELVGGRCEQRAGLADVAELDLGLRDGWTGSSANAAVIKAACSNGDAPLLFDSKFICVCLCVLLKAKSRRPEPALLLVLPPSRPSRRRRRRRDAECRQASIPFRRPPMCRTASVR